MALQRSQAGRHATALLRMNLTLPLMTTAVEVLTHANLVPHYCKPSLLSTMIMEILLVRMVLATYG
jgi:hypothetical protein